MTSQQEEQWDQQQHPSNEDKFTWKPGDVRVYDRIDEIPGFQPFPGKDKKTSDDAPGSSVRGRQVLYFS